MDKKLFFIAVLLSALMVLSFFAYNVNVSLTIKNNELQDMLLKQKQKTNIDEQATCAEYANKFYDRGEYKNSLGVNVGYTNHFNAVLNKCFILISYYSVNDDVQQLDLYDAVEGKHYASYIGHNICDPAVLEVSSEKNTKCQLDSGNIWFDGNDSRNPADYSIGFNGLSNGGIGDQNTQKVFMEHIQSFMNESGSK